MLPACKPVVALRTTMRYDGPVVRCATGEERERVLRETVSDDGNHVFFLESATTVDHVVALGFGWREDDRENRDPGDLAFFPAPTDPGRVLPAGETRARPGPSA